jgi:UDP-N-acetylglucosamine enolpyruvyl transferase
VISNGYYIDRGHANIAQRLRTVGGDVTAVEYEITL